MDSNKVIEIAANHLLTLSGHKFDLLTISKPVSPSAALNLAKVISKLSPLLGNLIEFNIVEFLNDQEEFFEFGKWERQDPGFPDAVFKGVIDPYPGLEVKAWFPLATEITARFKDSQNHFLNDHIHVAMLAWVPDNLIFGQPHILGVRVVSGLSVAAARDNHYHNPPDYIVLEPEDTKLRTRNLQQTNTNGYKWQGSPTQFEEAKNIVDSWGKDGRQYQPTREYQDLLRSLIARYPYRLDTNFAKMDRIVHPEIESFKAQVLNYELHGLSIKKWTRLLASSNDDLIISELKERLGIIEDDTEKLLH